jgi:hypothetical protein
MCNVLCCVYSICDLAEEALTNSWRRVSNCSIEVFSGDMGKGLLYLPSSSSSSYGMNIPDGVLLIPDGSPVRLDEDPDVCML